jgi:hypothetical protein
MPRQSEPAQGITLTTERARAGESTGRMRRVLIISTVLTIVAFFIVYVIWAATR